MHGLSFSTTALAVLTLPLAAASAAVERLTLPPLDPQALLAKDEGAKNGAPLRIAEPLTVDVSPDRFGTWAVTESGVSWHFDIHVDGATDISLGFDTFILPQAAALTIEDAKGTVLQGPYQTPDGRARGQLWTAAVPGDTVTIRLKMPGETSIPRIVSKNGDGVRRKAAGTAIAMHLSTVAAGYRDIFGIGGGPFLSKQGSCNVDVACAEADSWRNEVASIVRYVVNGFSLCSGNLIMDAEGSFTPFMLTANHCGIDDFNAGSIVVYHNFESPNCGDLGGGSLDQNQTGAIFRMSYFDSDVALVELLEEPDPGFSAYFAGWDRRDVLPLSAVGIHHPGGDEKAITFNTDAFAAMDVCNFGAGDNYWRVNQWEQGTTEPGSSGSGLWDPDSSDPYAPGTNPRIIGVLTGGFASCTVLDFDCYGKLSPAWDSGASAAQRLADWLDPNSTGAMFTDGAAPLYCGNSELNGGEQCDDGNLDDGDGCSSQCLVEPGYQCGDPQPAGTGRGADAVANNGFEEVGGWAAASANFDTPICNTDRCLGGSVGTGPFAGTHWAWFGGVQGGEEFATLEQDVTISAAIEQLSLQLEIPACDTVRDYFNVLLDDRIVFAANGADAACGSTGYVQHFVDLASAPGGPYNDGQVHTLRLEAHTVSATGGATSFFVDDVQMRGPAAEPLPSQCELIPDVQFASGFERPVR